MDTDRKYYSEINIARGFAALLVILGHALPQEKADVFGKNAMYFIHDYCYSFHMAVFFILAGFVAHKSLMANNVSVSNQIRKRALRLLVPYAVYSFVTVVLKPIFSAFAYRQFDFSDCWKILVGKNPNGGIWYLWTLFVISVFFTIFSRICKKIWVFLAIGVVCYGVFAAFPDCIVNNLLKYVVFYALGVLIKDKYRYAIKLFRNPISAILPWLVIFAVCRFTEVTPAVYPLTALLGCVGVMGVSLQIAKNEKSKLFGFFSETGNYSYDIYLLSYFVQVPIRVVGYTMLGQPFIVVSVAMAVFGAVIPYLISKFIIRRSKVLSLLLVGKID